MTDAQYLTLVRELPCCICGTRLLVTAHHITGAGLALKADDRETMPLCMAHHDDIHKLTGRFKGWNKAQLRVWQQSKVAETQRLLATGAIGAGDG